MNEQGWARIIMAVVAGSEDSDTALVLLTQLVPVIRADSEPSVAWEEQPEPEEPEEVEEPPAPTERPQRPVSKRPAAKAPAPRKVTSDGKVHLTDDQVQQLRRRRFKDGVSYFQLSEEFGCSESSVANLVQRKTHKDLPLVPGETGFQGDDAEAREARIQARRDRAAEGLDSHSFGGRKLPEAAAS